MSAFQRVSFSIGFLLSLAREMASPISPGCFPHFCFELAAFEISALTYPVKQLLNVKM